MLRGQPRFTQDVDLLLDNCLGPSRTLALGAGMWADDPATPPGLLQRGITLRKNDLFQAWQLVGAGWGADRAM
jgi:hypothetical protein